MKKKDVLKVLVLLVVVAVMGSCNKKTCPAYSQTATSVEASVRA